MDAAAIQRIESLAAASSKLPDTDVPKTLVPEGCKVESLESLLGSPLSMKAHFRTERLEDFCAYVAAEAHGDETAVFVEPDGSGAKAVIDYGSHKAPRWGRHQASLAMRHTPEFAALLQASETALSQRALVDFMEDWGHVVTAERGGEEITHAKAIAAIRRVDIKAERHSTHEQAEWSASRSSMEQIEARSGADSMPESITMLCSVFPCTKPREVVARLSLRTSGDEPRFRIRIVALDRMLKDVAEEIVEDVNHRLAMVRVFVGSA